jgi:acyl-CoA hydrolase
MVKVVDSAEACVDLAIERVGRDIRLGTPLGLGKPPQLVNAFYERAKRDPSISLHIYTGLTVEVPRPANHIEAGLAGPIMERLFGDYEEVAYMKDLHSNSLPANVAISEFYFKAGAMKGNGPAQRNYVSSNYTHVARDVCDAGVNVVAGLVATRERNGQLEISTSCNPDTTHEMLDLLKARGDQAYVYLAQAHPDLPFMDHDAVLDPAEVDLLLVNPAYDKTLFAVPNAAIPLRDYATALHVSSLIRDGGTLQIGIGSLGDAIAHACILRHEHNDEFRRMLDSVACLPGGDAQPADACEPFTEGLYGSTEMFVNGMMHLIEHGIISRRVYDDLALQQGLNAERISEAVDERLYAYGRASGLIPRHLDPGALERLRYWGIVPEGLSLAGDQLALGDVELANDLDDPATLAALLEALGGAQLRNGRILHGGFFLGPRDFYEKLRNLSPQLQEAICMTGVARTNQLLRDPDLYMAQRRAARFINTGMLVTLTGAVASDALEDGTVISGVGGQYNFVAMAHDLPGARSILCIRSTRGHGRHLKSNIVPSYGHTTIPRHLRDIIVTEYGVADLRGQTDEEVVKRLINVADSRFQPELLAYAKAQGKVLPGYEIPAAARNNTPQRLSTALAPWVGKGLLPDYPFGTELTSQEIALASTLREVKALSEEPGHFLATAFRALLHRHNEELARPWLERVDLDHPDTPRDFLIQQLLLLELEEKGFLKVS